MTTPQEQPIRYPNQPDGGPAQDGRDRPGDAPSTTDLPPPLTGDEQDHASPATQAPTGEKDMPIET